MRDFFHFDFSGDLALQCTIIHSRLSCYLTSLTHKKLFGCVGRMFFKKFSAGEPDSIFDISENAPKGYFQFLFHILTLSSVPELAGWQELWWLPQFSSLNWLITLLHLSLNKPKKIYGQSKCFTDTTSLLPISNIHLPFYSIYKLPIKVKAGKSQEHLCLHSDTNHAMVGIETLWKVKRTKKFPPFFAPSLSLSRSSSHIAGYCFFWQGWQ